LIDKYNGDHKSGSSAILGLLFDNKLYIATVGNSRAIMSTGLGDSVTNVTVEHIAHREKERIVKAGGSIYLDNNRIRINPGGMVISRSIGDVKNKLIAFGGIEGVIIPTPDVYCIDLNSNIDFILFGTSPLYDKLSNADIAIGVFHTANKCATNDDSFETFNKEVCRNFTHQALFKELRENISCIFLCGTNLFNSYDRRLTEMFINAIDDIKNKDFNIS
jgi:serine/threonine protein phosphatase PrpC